MDNQEDYYRCKHCRAKLFTEILHGEACSSYFINLPEWLQDTEENDVRLDCPKCKTKIGEVVWSGKKCSCLQWITPAVQVHHQKVDHIKPLGK